jgi:superfamily II DNA helicase RecQ
MICRFFTIPACDSAAAEEDLNRLLAASRVLGVERHFVADGEASFWAVCVRLAGGPGALPEALKAEQASARRVDYREVLSEDDFAVFAKLRELRKQIAETEGVPPYAVFTNDLARRPAVTASRLGDPQGARSAGRRERRMPKPTALRVAASAGRPAAR